MIIINFVRYSHELERMAVYLSDEKALWFVISMIEKDASVLSFYITISTNSGLHISDSLKDDFNLSDATFTKFNKEINYDEYLR
jgi:hypothetical protein